MNDLDKKQESILQAWRRGDLVKGWAGEFGPSHALSMATSSESVSKLIIDTALNGDLDCSVADVIRQAVSKVARELAAFHLGYKSLSEAEESDAAQPIENFSISIKSTTEAEINYTIGDEDRFTQVGFDVYFDNGEEESSDSPGAAATAQFGSVFGLDIAESHEWTKYLCEHGIEIEKELIRLNGLRHH